MNQQPEKRFFIVKPEGNRTERPCSRWADSIDMDIRIIGESNWKAMAVNRENWGRLPKKTTSLEEL
jgi:hypothetical protein